MSTEPRATPTTPYQPTTITMGAPPITTGEVTVVVVTAVAMGGGGLGGGH